MATTMIFFSQGREGNLIKTQEVYRGVSYKNTKGVSYKNTRGVSYEDTRGVSCNNTRGVSCKY